MAGWDALDESVQAQSAQVVGHASLRISARLLAEQGGNVLSKIAVGKTSREQTKEKQCVKERQNLRVPEPECGGPLVIDYRGSKDALQRVFADRAVVADSLDVEETPVGFEADLPEAGQVRQHADRVAAMLTKLIRSTEAEQR